MNRFAVLFAAAVLLLLSVNPHAFAIPAFARKYKTSCTTCHIGFPKLNAFGEAFRNNGYQFPGHADPEMVKEDPVSLGADTAFPREVWPGTIPGSSPIAVVLSGGMSYDPTEKTFSFGEMANSITALAGGTFGEDLSFWGQLDIMNTGVSIGRAFMRISNIVGDKYAFNARIGAFEPAVFTFSNRRTAFADYWMLSRTFSMDNAWSLEKTQKGVEFNGIVAGRMSYTAGVVEGYGVTHNMKDLYARALYKIGGMRLDGITEPGAPPPAKADPWRDNSVALGAFVYRGDAMLGPDTSTQENTFTMAGAEFNAWYDRFNLFGAFATRDDNAPFIGLKSTSVKTTTWFAELDAVALPWLIPCVRMESWSSSQADMMNMVSTYTDQAVKAGVIFVFRPNVTFSILTGWVNTQSTPMVMNMSMPMPVGHVHGALSETGQVMVHLMMGF